MKSTSFVVTAAATLLGAASAMLPGPKYQKPHVEKAAQIIKRQLPAPTVGVQSVVSPNGANITFKDPGQEGICETTPGVKSYAGFINLAPDVHAFVSHHTAFYGIFTDNNIVLVL